MSSTSTNAVRVLALDVDGVVLGGGESPGWDRDIEHDLGISPAVIQVKLFGPCWPDAAVGRASLRDGLAAGLGAEGLSVGADELIDYWLKDDVRTVNTDVIHEALMWQREFDGRLFLATNQEAIRGAHLWEGVGLRAHFDGMLASYKLGALKPAPEFFAAADATLDIEEPGQVLLIDDKEGNVEAARSHGWQATLASGEAAVVEVIQRLVRDSRS